MSKFYRKMTLGVFLLAISASFGLATVFAEERLRNLQIPENGRYGQSQTFRATDMGCLNATIQVRVKTILGRIPGSRFEVQLMYGRRVLRSRVVTTAGARYASISFRYRVSCRYTKSKYNFRIRNVTQTIRLPGEAKFSKVNPPVVKPPKTSTIGSLRVDRNRMGVLSVSRYLGPYQYGAKLEFNLNWMNTCRGRAGCKIKYILKRNGRTFDDWESSSRGRIRFQYMVRRSMIRGRWILEAHGPNLKERQRVRGTIKVTPRRQCR